MVVRVNSNGQQLGKNIVGEEILRPCIHSEYARMECEQVSWARKTQLTWVASLRPARQCRDVRCVAAMDQPLADLQLEAQQERDAGREALGLNAGAPGTPAAAPSEVRSPVRRRPSRPLSSQATCSISFRSPIQAPRPVHAGIAC